MFKGTRCSCRVEKYKPSLKAHYYLINTQKIDKENSDDADAINHIDFNSKIIKIETERNCSNCLQKSVEMRTLHT